MSGARARLRVLVLSSFHPELQHGGSQRAAYDLFRALAGEPGIEASFLAAVDDGGARALAAEVPVTAFDGRADEFLFHAEAYDPHWHKLCSRRAIDALAAFLAALEPEVVHFHHFLRFGIDALSLTRRVLPRARIVLTLHDLAAICPANGCMVRATDGSLCDEASPVRCHRCLPEHGPNRFEMRRLWFMRHLAAVDAMVAPSRFVRDRHVAWGLDPRRIATIPNGTAPAAPRPPRAAGGRARDRFGFFGQLIELKGVLTLLRAVSILRAGGFDAFSLEINGDNLDAAPEAMRREYAQFLAAEVALPRAAQIVTDNGAYRIEQIGARMARIDWCIVPSLWWEAFALVISEAWSFGRPVICSDAGAMAERVGHERDGLLFALGDEAALAGAMHRAATEPGLWDRLSSSIRPMPGHAETAELHRRVYERGCDGEIRTGLLAATS